MPLLLQGKDVRDTLADSLKQEILSFKTAPTLLIMQVGSREDSNAYIRQKKLFAEKIGAVVIHKLYQDSISQNDFLAEIKKYNTDNSIHGIIVQMPLPDHLDKVALIEAVDPQKDVDGLTSTNAALLYKNSSKGLMPATAKGITLLLDHYGIQVVGKKVTMVGRSYLVGRPTALALLNKNASVTVVHKHSLNVLDQCKEADILIVAIGKPKFITSDYVKKGQVIIDVGINSIVAPDGTKKLVGDVDFDTVSLLVDAITPVPGGVGPMTVAALFMNLVQAYTMQQ